MTHIKFLNLMQDQSSKPVASHKLIQSVIDQIHATKGTKEGNRATADLLSLIHLDDHQRIKKSLSDAGYDDHPKHTINFLRVLMLSPKQRQAFHGSISKAEAKESHGRLQKSWRAMVGACRETQPTNFKEIIAKHALKNGINWRGAKEAAEDLDKSFVAGYQGGNAGATGVSALAKGQNGDWEKEGYALSHYEGDHGRHYVTAHNAEGKKVGEYKFHSNDDGGLHPVWSETHTNHQRKGLASAAYALAEKQSGKKIAPSMSQTEDAQKLWRKIGRPSVEKIQKSLSKIRDLLSDE